MNRRDFFGIAAASIFAPRFGRWYRQGSGLIVRDVEAPQTWAPVPPPRLTVEHFVVTSVSSYSISVTRYPTPLRVPNGHSVNLRNRALFSDAPLGRRPDQQPPQAVAILPTADFSGFRVGDVIRGTFPPDSTPTLTIF